MREYCSKSLKKTVITGSCRQIFHTITLVLAVLTRLHNLVSYKINTYINSIDLKSIFKNEINKINKY